MSRRAAMFAVAVSALLAAGCAINPVTGERQLALLSKEQEIALGRQTAEEIGRTMAPVADEELQRYVSELGARLAATSERPDLPWQFQAVDDPTPNAFALPGGFIYVTRGLLSLMDSEAQLAAVLGHEIGHVTARHSVTQISRQQLAQLGLGLGMILSSEVAALGDLANVGLGLLFLSYGRDDERQADELGFRYMREQGYDPTEMAEVFEALAASSELAAQSPLPTWLASHPSEPERIAAVRARVAELPDAGGEVRRDEFLTRIDGLVYGDDPRNGYFAGDTFYHPELAFQVTIPESWRRQNLASAVVATSPERDAAFELTLVPGSPEEAAARFASASNVAVAVRESERINGNPAVVSRFRAAAEGGTVAGLVAHVAHGGQTYQLVAYSPEARYDLRAQSFERLLGSFAPLRDRDRLNVEARRIEIVELDRAMSFDEFARRYPSTIDVETLAVLNHVTDRSAELPAGTLLKRVVGGPRE